MGSSVSFSKKGQSGLRVHNAVSLNSGVLQAMQTMPTWIFGLSALLGFDPCGSLLLRSSLHVANGASQQLPIASVGSPSTANAEKAALLLKNTVHASNNASWSFLAKVFVLTIPSRPLGKKRLKEIAKDLHDLGLDSKTEYITGVDAQMYKTEAEEMDQDIIPMTDAMKNDWMAADFGYGPIHQGKSAEEMPSNGALACALGHHRIWELASKAGQAEPRAWSLILEDDAYSNFWKTTGASLTALFNNLPTDVDITFLDERHCRGMGTVAGAAMSLYARGSTAYAVTYAGAQALLSQPFSHGANHSLNVPIRNGQIKAFCHHSYYFSHNKHAESTIR